MNSLRTPRWRMTWAAGVLLMGVAVAVTGCGQRKVPSGFLTTYGDMKPLGVADGLVTWQATSPRLADYRDFLVDPVVVYFTNGPTPQPVEPGLLQEVGEYFRTEVVKALEADDVYRVVPDPAPGVCRLRIAVSEVILTLPMREAEWSLTLEGKALGGAAIEVEITDAQTGKLLATIMDTNVVARHRRDGRMTRWGHVKTVFKGWAQVNRQTIDTLRQ